MKRGKQIAAHVPQELSFSISCGRGMGGERHVTGKIFATVMALAVSYRFVGMIMMVPHGAEAKLLVHTQCSNPFPRFLVHAEFSKSKWILVRQEVGRVY